MSNEVVEQKVKAVLPAREESRFQLAQEIAIKLAGSRLVPAEYQNRPEDVFVAIQMGHDVGMSPFQAVQSIAVIDGKPCLYGDGLLGLVRGSGLCEYIKESWNEESKTAVCETLRKGEKVPTMRSFSLQDGALAGLTGRTNWKKYPQRMCQMRARSWCLRDAYADVLKGLRSAEEVADIQMAEVAAEEPQLETLDEAAPSLDTTLEDVLEDIEEAKTLADLVKASDRAKKLWKPEEQQQARHYYKIKRDALKKEAEHVEQAEAETE